VDKETQGEANVPAEHPAASPQARVPAPDVDAGRPGGHPQPATQGSPAAVGLIWRVRDRSTLQRVQRTGRRGQSGPVMVRFVPGDAPPKVAYAVGRPVGSAVVRNRVRRRLRAAARTLRADAALPDGTLLVRAEPTVTELTFDQVVRHLGRAVAVAVAAGTEGGRGVRA
jgi:ribonuclease P protein component